MAQELSEWPDPDSAGRVWQRPVKAIAPLRWAARSAQADFEACEGVGVLLVENGTVDSVVHTSPRAQQLDWIQAEVGDGPALVAIRQLQVFEVPDLWAPGPWPKLGTVAQALEIRSGLFVPVIEGGRALGALSFYSAEKSAFAGREQQALGLSADLARVLET